MVMLEARTELAKNVSSSVLPRNRAQNNPRYVPRLLFIMSTAHPRGGLCSVFCLDCTVSFIYMLGKTYDHWNPSPSKYVTRSLGSNPFALALRCARRVSEKV